MSENNLDYVIYTNVNMGGDPNTQIMQQYPTGCSMICEVARKTQAGKMDAVLYGNDAKELYNRALKWANTMDLIWGAIS